MHLLSLLICLACGQPVTNNATTAPPSNDTTIVLQYSGNTPITLYFESPLLESEPPFVLSAKNARRIFTSTIPILLYEASLEQIPLLLFPGDTVTLSKNGAAATLTSRQATSRPGEYRFLIAMTQQIGPLRGVRSPDLLPLQTAEYQERDRRYFAKYRKHLPAAVATREQRDSILFQLYQKRLSLLQEQATGGQLSPTFTSYLQQFLRYHYLTKSFEVLPYQQGRQTALPPALAAATSTSQPPLINDSLLPVETYRQFLYSYNLFLLRDTGSNATLAAMQSAAAQFSGRSRDFLLYALTKHHLDRNSQATYTEEVINLFKKECTDPQYKQIIQTSTEWMAAQQTASGDAITDAAGQSIPWKTMIEKFKGKIIYIDFWASWCMPCLEEMPNSYKLQQSLAGKPITFIYVSMDKNKEAWLKSMKTQTAYMHAGNSFLLTRNFDAPLARQLRLSTIPRYLLLDTNGRIIHTNAPRPGDPALPRLLQSFF